jgi:hypothetical protein
MSKVGLVLRELHRSENSLARDLLVVADRHRAEHEVFHVARDIARWSQEHVRRLAEQAAEHGVRLSATPSAGAPRVVERMVQGTSTLLGRRPETGLLLLADLRRLHRKAAGVSLDWEVLAQAAQGMRLRGLFELAQACHPETLRQMRWANAQLKVHSPQVIAS